MAAIRKKNPPLTLPPQRTLFGPKHNQPPSFRATGRGYANRLPELSATAKTANAVLINNATSVHHPLYRLYLFVDAVQTGWHLSGETTQAQTSRNFYPRNMAQDDLIIEGSVGNQYEFDRIVEFVVHSQLSLFNPGAQTLHGKYAAVSFLLLKPANGTLDVMPSMYYDIVFTNVPAGHERFVNFPNYQLTAKVAYDHLQKDETVEQSLNYWTTVKDVYGNVLPHVMSKGNDAPSKQKEHGSSSASDRHHHRGDT